MRILNFLRPNTATLDFWVPTVFKQVIDGYKIFKLLLHDSRGSKKAKQSHYRPGDALRVPGG
jgi:hypothetical protein